MLTICYQTNRRDCRIQYFFDSLKHQRERQESGDDIRIVVVDFYADEPGRRDEFAKLAHCDIVHVAPKPNVWNGPHRLTKEQWFAAASTRNTGLCLAHDGYVAFCDDLSVLLPYWLSSVREAMWKNYIVFGAYKKVKNLQVDNGHVVSFEEFPPGVDNRLKHKSMVSPCGGQWLYGCSLAAPVDALLDINGFGEICDGLGFEDCCTGIVLQNADNDLRYDPIMMTYESEELHGAEPPFRKEDWHFENGEPVKGGNGRESDKSHAVLAIAGKSKRFEYDVGGGFKDLRELRTHILNGGAWPVRENPRHDWYTKALLETL